MTNKFWVLDAVLYVGSSHSATPKNHIQVSGNCESRVKSDEFAPKPIDNLRK